MLTFCLDDSGGDEHPIVTLAGYAALSSHWQQFEDRGRQLLASAGVEYVSGKELYHRRGQFKNWTSVETDKFIRALFRILGDYAIVGCEFSVDREKFEIARTREGVKREGSSFAFCFKGLLTRFMREPGIEELVRNAGADLSFVIERGRKTNAGIMTWFDDIQPQDPELLSSLVFEDKKALVGLQMADLLAFYSRRIRCSTDESKRAIDVQYFEDVSSSVTAHQHFIATDFFADD